MGIFNDGSGTQPRTPKFRWVPWVLVMVGVIGALSWAEAQEAPGIPNLPNVPFEYVDDGLPAHFSSSFDNTPPDNPTTNEGATLGRVLFYDVRLSANDTTSCASCHDQALAFADSGRFSVGFEGELTTRNSMGLTNARFYPRGHFLWGEEADTLEDQVLLPVDSPIELGLGRDNLPPKLETTNFYPQLFEDAFGSSDITTDRIARALAQFVRSLATGNSKFDQGVATSFTNFTASEEQGRQIFLDSCGSCHSGDLQIALREPTNNASDLTLADPGAGEGRFKVPSLRNIELTGPYMHDGSIETLEGVVEHYNSGIPANEPLVSFPLGGPLNLSDDEKTALVDFMVTLTDPGFTTDVRFSDPFVAGFNEPPEVTVPSDTTFVVDEPILLQLSAVDPEGDPIAWSAIFLPDWLSIDADGLITGVAPEPGDFRAEIAAFDGTNEITVGISITIQSEPANAPPIIAAVDRQAASLNAAFSLEVEVSDPENQPVVLSATGLPAGLSLLPGTNLISGTATELGEFTVTLVAEDPFDTTSLSFRLDVIEEEVRVTAICGVADGPTQILVNLTNPFDVAVFYEVAIGDQFATLNLPPNAMGAAPQLVDNGLFPVSIVRHLSPTVGALVFEDVIEVSCGENDQLMHAVSCLAGNGRFDLNVVNSGTAPATYRVLFEGLTPRASTVAPGDWWRMAVTGRAEGDYEVEIRRDGRVVSNRTITIACDGDVPVVDTDEVRVLNACRAGLGFITFQFVNASAEPKSWVIEFESVPNRSTSAQPFGATTRAVTGRQNGSYLVVIRSDGEITEAFDVDVRC